MDECDINDAIEKIPNEENLNRHVENEERPQIVAIQKREQIMRYLVICNNNKHKRIHKLRYDYIKINGLKCKKTFNKAVLHTFVTLIYMCIYFYF